jgi:hypothetical protein
MSIPALAQQSERFGPYELHYSVVNTTFIEPQVAANYDITRGKKRAILNLSVREHPAETPAPEAEAEAEAEAGRFDPPTDTEAPADITAPTKARAMQIQGKTWDLIQNQPLTFREIREGPAIYYIAEFRFINEEWRFFEIDFRPEGADRTYTFKFRQQVFIN